MKRYALAVDIGTTTITVGLINLVNKKEIAMVTRLNPQARYGEDIISRLDWCIKDKNGLARMHNIIINCINRLIEKLLKEKQIRKIDLEKTVVVGNTVMEHFFLKKPVKKLAEAPYLSDLPKGIIETTRGTYLLPIIKSFVGSDLTAGVLYTGLFRKKGVGLLIDIGTNGEIALVKGEKFFVASTAAGPAFEAGIKTMRGSDIIEKTASMLKNGIIDKNGRIKGPRWAKLSQSDVRKVQVAKAAIMAAVLTLIKKADVEIKDIESLYVAGKFGNFINKKAAINIGILPDIPLNKIRFVGNAAYKGAIVALCSEKALRKTEDIAKKAIHVSLFGRKDFKEEFVKEMRF